MKRYPVEVQDFISENVSGKTTKEITDMVNSEFGLNLTNSKVRAYKKNHGLKSGAQKGIASGLPTEKYPQDVRDFIKENYPGIGPTEMSTLLNKHFGAHFTAEQMKGYYARNKFDSGVRGYFKKGQVPFNKGKKKYWVGGEETQFKKGHIPQNYRPVGSERINVDGYVEIKIADPNKWQLKNRVLWEKANGPIPKGCAVIFGDGDRSNLDISNLILVSQAQLLTLNKKELIQNSAELTRSAIIIVDVLHKISQKQKSM